MDNVSGRVPEKQTLKGAPARAFAASRRDDDRVVVAQAEFGSAWYHEAAIRKAEKPQHRG